jgi:hypothetical protein
MNEELCNECKKFSALINSQHGPNASCDYFVECDHFRENDEAIIRQFFSECKISCESDEKN